ncbi:hypothetical protein OF83DRAFT_900898 [Amylostereum chailletii]|nr:hypothetical protein OF83DRAFT_900898 [Amylostereum chailletii]
MCRSSSVLVFRHSCTSMVYLARDTYEAARNGLRPATIAQLVKADQAHSDADFTIEDVAIHKVSVVACVCIVTVADNGRSYTLEDGSRGSIRCKAWTQSKDGKSYHSSMIDTVQQTDYIHVVGLLRKYHGTNEIVALAIHRIVDYHQVFYHQLNALVTTLTFERGPPQPSATSSYPTIPSQTYLRDTVAGSSRSSSDVATKVHDPSAELEDFIGDSRPTTEPHVQSSDSEPEQAEIFMTPPVSRSPSPEFSKIQIAPQPHPYTRRDPLSHLSSLQRAVLVQIKNSEELYFEGVPIGLIVKAVHFQSLDELEYVCQFLFDTLITYFYDSDAIVALMDEELIYHTHDYSHFLSV